MKIKEACMWSVVYVVVITVLLAYPLVYILAWFNGDEGCVNEWYFERSRRTKR